MTGKATFRPTIHGLLATLFVCVPATGLAWNSAGHRLVAAIAWERLKPEAREEASRLLRQHPDHASWAKRAGEQDSERRVFIEASTWPDDIRKDKRFYSQGRDEATPTQPGFPDMERRSAWHYVNIPLNSSADGKPVSGQLDRQLPELEKTLGTSGSEHQRSYALPWLIHLVGDAHQPLHTSVRLDAEGKWDKLGNGLEVLNPFNSRKPVSTLHAFWDDLPGPPWLRGDRLDAAAQALMAVHSPSDHSIASKRWIEESWQIARNSAYPPENETPPEITKTFYEDSREIADRRVAQGGYRLAALLNQLLGPKQPANQR